MAQGGNVSLIGIDVMRAWPRRHEAVHLELPEEATVAEAIAASGFSMEGVAALAIFGECVDAGHRLRDGDRVELLRPLEIDPKDARRRRARSK